MSNGKLNVTRRQVLKWIGLGSIGLGAGAYLLPKSKPEFSSSLKGANSKVGHLLRREKNGLPPFDEIQKCSVLIVGGGIAGLSAGWWLSRHKYSDFIICELDQKTGGNSRSGANSVSKFPYGAHYLPLPNKEAQYVLELLQEMKILKGYQQGLPVYDEYCLCADPHERLFFQGKWQEGLVPNLGVSQEEKATLDRFFQHLSEWKWKKGSDGKYVFSIPLELSSQDPIYLALDKISMKEYLIENKFQSEILFWYVNYCSRDDYGAPFDKISAWAGLHYFCSRRGTAFNSDSQSVLTWPEGNGHFVDYLSNVNKEKIKTNSLVVNIASTEGKVLTDVLDVVTQKVTRYESDHVIYSAPRYTAKRVIKDYSQLCESEYYPWLIANITLKQKPVGEGAPLSWDNVSYYSPSLGYILANHQDLKFNQKECVITYYLPWNQGTASESRKNLSQKSELELTELVRADLEKMHRGITKEIKDVQLWQWGHGMVSPGVNFLWSKRKHQYFKKLQRIHFAHSDMSGISIFEEAQFHGVEAAKKILGQG